ncbi:MULTISPECIES: RraA family protein [unclassified Herbaspirillum]|uniref:RraA family protein n=1 Tax=unclassified Herbaspirillum TaxID=2624150 RepID=UPI00114F65EA|nr:MULTISPECIES: RraA family protein [unclassified Herbaspirillum]MBB5393532.1 RraA family protein [Herbaspirillum sp. SJZ102]TQK03720.1 RraA family protein [Herbaspirillum sp. SJZ130]TQK08452.1 RraA family protein [Herbaspirillum sp. SJZ106]
MSNPSFIINPAPAVAEAGVVDALRGIVVSHLSDNLQRLSGVTALQRIHRSTKLVGTAFTLKTRPGDNLLIYKALTMMQPGHVLVVDGGGEASNALVGELIMLYAQQRGCAGFVIDAAVRDTAAFYAADFPCYARAVSHRGPYKNGPGQINVPVSIDGQVIGPGDLIVGDEDGIVSFPQAEAAALIAAARQTAANEDAIKAEIANGKLEQAWLDKVLKPFGL